LKSDTTALGEVAYVGVGLNTDNAFAARMRRDHNATVYYFDYSKKSRFNADDAGQNCDAA
jgi:hypothetical protein